MTSKKRVSYNSKEMYDSIVSKIAPTNCQLRVSLEEYLALKLKQKGNGSVPSVARCCNINGVLNINQFLHRGALQACFCNGGLLWSSDLGKQRIDVLVDSSKYNWECYETRHLETTSALSRLSLVCTHCGGNTTPTVAQFVNGVTGCARTSSCRPPRPGEWSHPSGRSRLDLLVKESRFNWKHHDTRHAEIAGEDSRIDLVCSLCGVEVSPLIGTFVSRCSSVGCGCNNATELKVFKFVCAVVDQLFVDRHVKVVMQYKDTKLRGTGGRCLSNDIAILEYIDGHHTVLLVIEVDGGHHFDPNFTYSNNDVRTRHTLEHDILKEEYVFDQQVSMARLEVTTVSRNRTNWAIWLQSIAVAAINHQLKPCIYRHSSGSHYNQGPYAERRHGLPIDVNRTVEIPVSTYSVVKPPDGQ